MPKKQSLKEPNGLELEAIAELFGLGIQALDAWGGDDDFLMNMGSIVPEDIDEEGSEGREQLLEILQKAGLPGVTSEDMEVQADDLRIILPAIGLVLQNYKVPGLKPGSSKKFEKAQRATFAQVALDAPSQEIEQKTHVLLQALFKNRKNVSAEIRAATIPVEKSDLEKILIKEKDQTSAPPSSSTSQIIIISYCEGYDCIGWFSSKEHGQSVIDSQYFNDLYYSIEFMGEAEALATSDASGAILLRKEFSQIKNKNEYAKNIPQEKVAEYVEWLSAEVVNRKHSYNGVNWNQYIEYFPEGLIGHAS